MYRCLSNVLWQRHATVDAHLEMGGAPDLAVGLLMLNVLRMAQLPVGAGLQLDEGMCGHLRSKLLGPSSYSLRLGILQLLHGFSLAVALRFFLGIYSALAHTWHPNGTALRSVCATQCPVLV